MVEKAENKRHAVFNLTALRDLVSRRLRSRPCHAFHLLYACLNPALTTPFIASTLLSFSLPCTATCLSCQQAVLAMHNLPLQLKTTSTSLSKIIILVLAGNNCHLLFFYCTIADNTMRTSCFSSDNTTLKASHWLNCTNFAICDTPVNFSQ